MRLSLIFFIHLRQQGFVPMKLLLVWWYSSPTSSSVILLELIISTFLKKYFYTISWWNRLSKSAAKFWSGNEQLGWWGAENQMKTSDQHGRTRITTERGSCPTREKGCGQKNNGPITKCENRMRGKRAHRVRKKGKQRAMGGLADQQRQ